MLALQILLASVFWLICERPFLNRSSRIRAEAPAPRVFEATG
jgi:peptidoglycan/LPS O-acetylase OafA/YrhL